ncbi:MAG: DUF4251 domain-containing protein [Bacteroidales bacterium]|nr:DUF4251 domain-containing protein [Bacteroidales bacterium]
MRALRFVILLVATAMIAAAGSGCKALKGSEESAKADSINYVVGKALIENQTFLMSVNRVMIMNVTIPSVTPTTNFILVMGDKGVVQLSPGHSGGPNGVGGFTVKGNITDYKYSVNKNGEVNLQFHLSAPIGSCDVQATMVKGSNRATAFVQSTFHRGRTTMYGTIQPIDDSYFEGHSIF